MGRKTYECVDCSCGTKLPCRLAIDPEYEQSILRLIKDRRCLFYSQEDSGFVEKNGVASSNPRTEPTPVQNIADKDRFSGLDLGE
jgi:hypothetical protein